MSADLLEIDRADGASIDLQLLKPTPEAQIAHAAAVEPGGLERQAPAGGHAHRTQGPAGRGAEVEGEDDPASGYDGYDGLLVITVRGARVCACNAYKGTTRHIRHGR
ncbi:MAG: hypothetical protein IPP45_14795 [Sphingomonadales bacterium]|nr:hypothetical protein [Sphingomonadales bacterium]